ncbi:putative inorganic phosphate cotransporter isoform X1 [Teleopsis dalmanni]|uniref:putative inorganic phosphate cotransporter isoform X1 n=1 Tax=Teleopsis dalmanni TaxID=139649 RepID=UPI0018CDC2FA|nr:putative inorganic phosphate cotransporter isoform X1 [Teleopsis dalmanni]
MAKNRRYEPSGSVRLLGVRHLQCFLLFLGTSVAFAMRVNLSMAIVAMLDTTSTTPGIPVYNWSEKTKSVVLSSFFWGYVGTQVPGGYLARKFGGKAMLLYGVLISSVLTILTPVTAKIGNWQLLCASRLLQGLSQGVFFPSVHTILSQWAPLEERGLLGTFSYVGSQFGTVVMLATSGIMISSSYGWPSIFYISGFVGLLWVVVWVKWGASTPSDFKTISASEKHLIESSIGHTNEESAQNMKIPWKRIFTSVPFWVLFCVHCAHNWGFWTLLIEIPSYLKHVLNMNIKSNALLSALPYTVMLILGIVFAIISTVLSKRKCIPLTLSRKIFNTIGHWVPMVTLICLCYVEPGQTTLAILLLTITVGINSAVTLGFQINHIDLSPNFAGVLMGITNCAANITGIIAPLAVGFIVTDVTSAEQWNQVFFIAAGIYFVGNLLFISFGTANVQPWNDPLPKPQELSLIEQKPSNING